LHQLTQTKQTPKQTNPPTKPKPKKMTPTSQKSTKNPTQKTFTAPPKYTPQKVIYKSLHKTKAL
jgi:hypothetical protein